MLFVIIMPNIETAKKIIEFLKQKETAVTPTTIHKETRLNYVSVLCSLNFLIDLGLVNSVTDGHIKLVCFRGQKQKLKGESNEHEHNRRY